MTVRTALRERGCPRPSIRSRRPNQPSRQRVKHGLVVATLGAALAVALLLSWSIAPAGNEADDGERLQTLWTDPLPPFVVSALAGRGAAQEQRSLIPTDPPRILGAPAATTREIAPPATRGGIPIRVFFSRRPDSDSVFSAVFPVARVAPGQAVATAALTAMIEGPNAAERASGYFSELGTALTGTSSCSGRDFRIAITNGTATVRFCRAITSAGVGQDARIRSQIEATLRQFSTIQRVNLIGSSGRCLFDESGQDRCLDTRATVVPPPDRRAGAR